MSAPLSFIVNLMVGRTLTIMLEARNAEAAEDIASWLYQEHGDRFFTRSAESSFDCTVAATVEAAS